LGTRETKPTPANPKLTDQGSRRRSRVWPHRRCPRLAAPQVLAS
jgi:hypothetical protein